MRAVRSGDSELIEELANEVSSRMLNFRGIYTVVDLELMILLVASDVYLECDVFRVTLVLHC